VGKGDRRGWGDVFKIKGGGMTRQIAKRLIFFAAFELCAEICSIRNVFCVFERENRVCMYMKKNSERVQAGGR